MQKLFDILSYSMIPLCVIFSDIYMVKMENEVHHVNQNFTVDNVSMICLIDVRKIMKLFF